MTNFMIGTHSECDVRTVDPAPGTAVSTAADLPIVRRRVCVCNEGRTTVVMSRVCEVVDGLSLEKQTACHRKTTASSLQKKVRIAGEPLVGTAPGIFCVASR